MELFWGCVMMIIQYLQNLFYINFNNLRNCNSWAGICLDFEKPQSDDDGLIFGGLIWMVTEV